VALTNSWNAVEQDITYHEFKEGTNLCNIFNSGDCVKVTGGKIRISLINHDTKVYVPSTRLESE